MKCNICGAELKQSEAVCSFCGNIILGAQFGEDSKREVKKPENGNISSPCVNVENESVIVSAPSHIRNKFCTQCGRELDALTQRCSVCDASYRVERGYEVRANAARTTRLAVERNKKQKSANVLIAVAMILIVLFIVSFVIFFSLLGGRIIKIDEEAATTAPTAVFTDAVDVYVTDAPVVDDTQHWKPANE